MKLKIRKGATVKVITGSEKGKSGVVLDVDQNKMRVRVKDVRLQTKHSKQDGLKKLEGYIHYSNVALVEAAKKKAPAKKTKSKSA